jgi:hypothetical protein
MFGCGINEPLCSFSRNGCSSWAVIETEKHNKAVSNDIGWHFIDTRMVNKGSIKLPGFLSSFHRF